MSAPTAYMLKVFVEDAESPAIEFESPTPLGPFAVGEQLAWMSGAGEESNIALVTVKSVQHLLMDNGAHLTSAILIQAEGSSTMRQDAKSAFTRLVMERPAAA